MIIRTIEDMQKLAQERNGKCLSEKYIDNNTKLKWQCGNGHIWEMHPKRIKSGYWCRECSGRKKITIEYLQNIAIKNDGELLSTEYKNNKTPLLWKCSNEHTWQASAMGIIKGQWCAKCQGRAKATIEEMHELAESKGGKCLNTEYVNNKTNLKWQCSENHVWKAQPYHIKTGSWCPYCANRVVLSIDYIRNMVENKEGILLIDAYKNNKTKFKVQCKEGHIWNTNANRLQHGLWCKTCAGKDKLTIEYAQNIAKKKGGKLLSTEYKSNEEKMLWQCNKGHTWYANLRNVRKKTWCPECYKDIEFRFITERKCRKAFEKILKTPFKKINPDWLRNPKTNRKLELDGYSAEFNMAFEYNGIQHYELNKFNNNNQETLDKIQYRDKVKMKLCEKQGVKLFVLKDLENIKYKKIKKYIKKLINAFFNNKKMGY